MRHYVVVVSQIKGNTMKPIVYDLHASTNSQAASDCRYIFDHISSRDELVEDITTEWDAENDCGVIHYPDGSESHVDYILMNESGEETFEMYAEMCNKAYNLFDTCRDVPKYNDACIKLSWLETLFMNLVSEDKERNEEAAS